MIYSLFNSPSMNFSTKSSSGTRKQSKGVHINFHHRLLMLASIFITMFVIFTMTHGFAMSQNNGFVRPSKMVEYVVQPGDTLWAIAKKNQPNQNLYCVLDNIEQYNHVNDNENLYPGEKLWIPIK